MLYLCIIIIAVIIIVIRSSSSSSSNIINARGLRVPRPAQRPGPDVASRVGALHMINILKIIDMYNITSITHY